MNFCLKNRLVKPDYRLPESPLCMINMEERSNATLNHYTANTYKGMAIDDQNTDRYVARRTAVDSTIIFTYESTLSSIAGGLLWTHPGIEFSTSGPPTSVSAVAESYILTSQPTVSYYMYASIIENMFRDFPKVGKFLTALVSKSDLCENTFDDIWGSDELWEEDEWA